MCILIHVQLMSKPSSSWPPGDYRSHLWLCKITKHSHAHIPWGWFQSQLQWAKQRKGKAPSGSLDVSDSGSVKNTNALWWSSQPFFEIKNKIWSPLWSISIFILFVKNHQTLLFLPPWGLWAPALSIVVPAIFQVQMLAYKPPVLRRRQEGLPRPAAGWCFRPCASSMGIRLFII